MLSSFGVMCSIDADFCYKGDGSKRFRKAEKDVAAQLET